MKVTLQKVTVTDVDVDIPPECPKCKAPFVEPEGKRTTWVADEDHMNLVEDQWVAAQQRCTLVEENGIGWADDYSTGNNVEGSLIIGYRCVCGHILASTEGT
jgi:hypothetical protein